MPHPDDAYDASEDRYSAALEFCEQWCRDQMDLLPDTLKPWGDDEPSPARSAPVVEQYRYYLFEREEQDSQKERDQFLDGLIEDQMDLWSQRRNVAWCGD